MYRRLCFLRNSQGSRAWQIVNPGFAVSLLSENESKTTLKCSLLRLGTPAKTVLGNVEGQGRVQPGLDREA